MSTGPVFGDISWERMIRAVEQVKERLQRAVAALEGAGIPYAVAGGNAVAAWVSRVDEAAVRNTRDVDILLRRADLPGAIEAMERAGFRYRHAMGIDMFLDGPSASARDAVHVVFAGEKVRQEYLCPAPEVDECDESGGFRIVELEALVRMKLTSFRRKDQVHILDLIELGLIDASWTARFPSELADRLQELLDTPEG
jgi:hypothetical protein